MATDQQPLFTVVIPTKNRPDYLDQSIQSVLYQDFDDYELIVSDNYNEQPTQEVISKYQDYPKFKSVRTDQELNMIDHWEFATKKANGKYVLLLADRKILHQGGLKKLAENVNRYPQINVFSYATKVYNDLNHEMGWAKEPGDTIIYKTKDLVGNFLNANYFNNTSLDFKFPKTLNGIYKNSFAQKVRSRIGQYFNTTGVITPDYSSFFINMALNEEAVYIGETIVLTQGEHTSNGRNFGKGQFEAYMNSLGLENPYTLVPIKAPYIYNLLVIDFLIMKQLLGGTLASIEVNWGNYLDVCFWEYLMKEKADLLDKEGLHFFYNGWQVATKQYKEYNLKEQEQVMRDSYSNYGAITWKDKVKDISSHAKAFIKYRFGHLKWVNNMLTKKYSSVMEAAAFSLPDKA